ncbi:MAG: WG repeat-containing protein [Winogradskyella sp.]|uniref:WG repeat-containing protein n=1 Tax=Winogradskyella sp. TaxID=1883156 RepID=UPI00385E632E
MAKKVLLLFAIMFTFNLGFAQDTYDKLYRFKQNNLYGFIDNKGNVIVQPQYTSTGIFSEGLCAVTKRQVNKTLLGYIDAKGNLVIPLRFQQYLHEASDFKEGMAVVRLNNKSGYIDKNGKIIVEPTLYKGYPFNSGYAVIEKDNHAVRSVINKKGEILFDPVKAFKSQKRYVSKGIELLYLNDKVCDGVITFHVSYHSDEPTMMKLGYFDMQGKMKFPIDYLAGNYHEGLVVARDKASNTIGYLDKNGKLIIPFNKFKNVSDFKNNRAIVQDIKSKMYGIINKDGDYIVAPKYRQISKKSYFSDVIMAYDESGKAGYLSSKGRLITGSKYKYGYDFAEGLALVYSNENGYQYIDKQGNPAFELSFKKSHPNFKGDLAKVLVNDKLVYINKKGEIVFRFP